jgi:hypothetical protein
MPSTDALATWGAVTGTIGSLSGATAAVALYRDKPRLTVTATVVRRSGDRPELHFMILNWGRQPVVVVDAGVAQELKWKGIGPFRRRRPSVVRHRPADVELPIGLLPGTPMTWRSPLEDDESLADVLLRLFVQDARRQRYRWGWTWSLMRRRST